MPNYSKLGFFKLPTNSVCNYQNIGKNKKVDIDFFAAVWQTTAVKKCNL